MEGAPSEATSHSKTASVATPAQPSACRFRFLCCLCLFVAKMTSMKILLILILSLGCIGVVAVQEKESKTQPKEVVLGKDSQSDKYGEVAFNHENHSIKKYSPDGQSVLTCVECHHTDQPPAGLKPPLKTSEREVVLTAEILNVSEAKPVKSCRVCHLQAGDDSAAMPA